MRKSIPVAMITLISTIMLSSCHPKRADVAVGTGKSTPEPVTLIAVPEIDQEWLVDRVAALGSTGAQVKWRRWEETDGNPRRIEVWFSEDTDEVRAVTVCGRVSDTSKGAVIRKVGGLAPIPVTVILPKKDPGPPTAGTSNCRVSEE